MKIKLQLLLNKSSRTELGGRVAREAASLLGMQPTSSGVASFSAEMESNLFAALFGHDAPAELPPSPDDAVPLKVPPALSQHVDSITIAPAHIYLKG